MLFESICLIYKQYFEWKLFHTHSLLIHIEITDTNIQLKSIFKICIEMDHEKLLFYTRMEQDLNVVLPTKIKA